MTTDPTSNGTPGVPLHIPALDGLRGLAAYLVFFSHYSLASGIFGGFFGSGGGQLGVMFFFMLSGFLMEYLYASKKPSLFNMTSFAVKRVARILPLFYFMVLAALVFGFVFPDINTGYPVTERNLYYHLFLIRGVGAFWTIPVEMQFYLIFLLTWFTFRQFTRIKLVAMIALILLMFWDPRALSSISHMRIATPAICYFLIGMGIYHFSDMKKRAWFDYLFVAALLAMPLLYPRIYAHLLSVPQPPLNGKLIFGMWNNPFYPLVLSTIFVCVLHGKLAASLFESRIFAYLGKISFSLYLWQAPCLHLMKHVFNLREHPYVGFVLVNLVLLAISTASFAIIETPSRRAIVKVFRGSQPLQV